MAESSRSAKSKTKKAAKKVGFTDEERVAMKERVQELKAAARRGPRADKGDGESAVLAHLVSLRRTRTFPHEQIPMVGIGRYRDHDMRPAAIPKLIATLREAVPKNPCTQLDSTRMIASNNERRAASKREPCS